LFIAQGVLFAHLSPVISDHGGAGVAAMAAPDPVAAVLSCGDAVEE
jgi:hypothetical protein